MKVSPTARIVGGHSRIDADTLLLVTEGVDAGAFVRFVEYVATAWSVVASVKVDGERYGRTFEVSIGSLVRPTKRQLAQRDIDAERERTSRSDRFGRCEDAPCCGCCGVDAGGYIYTRGDY